MLMLLGVAQHARKLRESIARGTQYCRGVRVNVKLTDASACCTFGQDFEIVDAVGVFPCRKMRPSVKSSHG